MKWMSFPKKFDEYHGCCSGFTNKSSQPIEPNLSRFEPNRLWSKSKTASRILILIFQIFLWIYLHNKRALWLSTDEIKSNCIIVFLASLFWSSDLWRSKGQKEGQEWMLCYATQSTKYFTPHWKFRKTNNRSVQEVN